MYLEVCPIHQRSETQHSADGSGKRRTKLLRYVSRHRRLLSLMHDRSKEQVLLNDARSAGRQSDTIA